MKTYVALISDQKSYEKILATADKSCTLLLLYYEGEDKISLQTHEALANAKCKVTFMLVKGRDEIDKKIFVAYICGQLSISCPDYELLTDFGLNGCISILGVSEHKTKTRTKKEKPSETKVENAETPVPAKPAPVRRRKTKATSEPVRESKTVSETHGNDDFEHQFDKLLDVLSKCNNGDINPANHAKHIVDAMRTSESEHMDLFSALKFYCNTATATALYSAIKKSDSEIRAIVNVLKDEI